MMNFVCGIFPQQRWPRCFLFVAVWAILLGQTVGSTNLAEEVVFRSELVFPLHAQHNHAPGIVECPNGDLLASWYRGSGERRADDVAVYGSRLTRGEPAWSDPFLMADYPDFPDCNTCLFIDQQQRLWLFWPIILANTWESCLTNFQVATDYSRNPIVWTGQGTIFLKPADFSTEAKSLLAEALKKHDGQRLGVSEAERVEFEQRLDNKLLQRLGWQPRCKPAQLPDGRLLLPLYSDTYSFSLMAITDDQGKTWRPSKPLMGFGNIQPSVLRRNDGTLVAYMRENGPRDRIRVSESRDRGETWSPVGETEFPNPGSGVDAVRLANGHWIIVYNDSTNNRSSLAVSLSEDEGRTWPWTRHLERHETGSYHYPAVIQGGDGTIHAIYSYFVAGGKSMKHVALNEAWIRGAD